MGTEDFINMLNEKDVENGYRHLFLKKFPNMIITSPFGCDGYGVDTKKSNTYRVLMEFKYDVDLTNKLDRVKVITQMIFYIKKFENKGEKLPTIIFVGDKNECFVLHVNNILDYLDMDIDWSVAPSSAYKNTELITNLLNDPNINPFIFKINDLEQCLDKIKDIGKNTQRKVRVHDKNIVNVFQYFEKDVLGKNKLTTNEKANLFIQLLVNDEENYLHPVEKFSQIVTKSFGHVKVKSRDSFKSFFSHFSTSYSPSDKHKLSAVVDRIVEDETRRKQGEFFTPTIWVDKAHEYITSVYGDDWKEKYVVWDPAWGTGNLTRDYKFKELYVSTLNQSDIDTANQMGYNPEAVKFQYDFLNDDYEKLPQGLRDAIEGGREIIVFMNPPYGASGNNKRDGNQKESISKNIIGQRMNEDKMGFAARNLYLQFIYKIVKDFNNIDICMFAPPTFICSESNKTIHDLIFGKMDFKNGFIMDAKNFADVKSWALSFSILTRKK